MECLQSWQGRLACRLSILDVLCRLMEEDRAIELAFAQRLVAEVRPDLYFVIARLFVEVRLLALRMNAGQADQPAVIWDVSSWFLGQTAYVIQYFVDQDARDPAGGKAEFAMRDVRSILSLFANALGEDHHGSIDMIEHVRDALASTELPPEAVFNIEDKLHAIEFKRPRLCAFGSRKSPVRFVSATEIAELLESRRDVINHKFHDLTNRDLFDALEQLIRHDQTILVNWIPFAEQTPFSLFFGLIQYLARARGRAKIAVEFVPMKMEEARPALANEDLTVAISNSELCDRIDYVGRSANVIARDPCFVSSSLIKYSGYGVLAKQETVFELGGDLGESDQKRALLERLGRRNSTTDVYFSSLEFARMAQGAGLRRRRFKDLDEVEDSLSAFLNSADAVYFDGAVQIRYLARIFSSKVVAFPKLLETAQVQAFLLTRSRLPASPTALGDFAAGFLPEKLNEVIFRIWEVARELTAEVFDTASSAPDPLIKKVRRGFRHDMSLYSTDLIVSDFASVANAFKEHSNILAEGQA